MAPSSSIVRPTKNQVAALHAQTFGAKAVGRRSNDALEPLADRAAEDAFEHIAEGAAKEVAEPEDPAAAAKSNKKRKRNRKATDRESVAAGPWPGLGHDAWREWEKIYVSNLPLETKLEHSYAHFLQGSLLERCCLLDEGMALCAAGR